MKDAPTGEQQAVAIAMNKTQLISWKMKKLAYGNNCIVHLDRMLGIRNLEAMEFERLLHKSWQDCLVQLWW